MSLYNQIFGRNPFAQILMAMLELTEEESGRFRDCYLARGDRFERQDLAPPELANKELRIVVFTRNGTGNRESYKAQIEIMRAKPGFITDYDDDFDSTYASFEFKVPKAFETNCRQMDEITGGVKEPMKKFSELIEKLRAGDTSDPAVRRAAEVGSKILGDINKAIAESAPGTIPTVKT